MFGGLAHVSMGFGKGLSLTDEAREGQEIAQGQSHIAAAITYTSGIWEVYALAQEVIPQNRRVLGYSPHTILGIACVAGMITQLFLSVVKSGYYGRIVDGCDYVKDLGRRRWGWIGHSVAYCASLMPRQEGECLRKVASFACKNMHRIILGANAGLMLALGVKEPLYGGAALVGMGLDALDHAGYVPRSVSPYIRKSGEWSSALSGLFTTNRIVRVLHVIQVVSLLPSLIQRVQWSVDKILLWGSALPLATLEEIDTPLGVCQRDMVKALSFNEIQRILDASPSAFSINFVHCSEQLNTSALPSHSDLELLKVLFDEIDWSQHIELVQKKCRTDDRFLDHFETACAEKRIEIEKNSLGQIQNFESAFEQLMRQQETTGGDFYLSWYRAQMGLLVDALLGKERLLGREEDWSMITKKCEHILAYLMQLEDSREKVDVFLTLAVEGGAYCALGVQRMTEGLIARIIGVNATGELRLFQELERERLRMLQSLYVERQWGTSGDDVHSFDNFKMIASFGFSPITPSIRSEYSIGHVLGRAFLLRSSKHAQRIQRLHAEYCTFSAQILSNQKEVLWSRCERANRVRQILGEAPLTPDQRDIIDQAWEQPGAQERFDRLLLVLLGVLKLK
jgi:hypothetical protein